MCQCSKSTSKSTPSNHSKIKGAQKGKSYVIQKEEWMGL